ncbi:MAG: HD-GYP domain-containing protein [Treponema sp.]|jgi:HD-GYP domain-containing protein (c-di-GMP phosphodiesterase class II)|nr:HD-GYP domain-containing protein [Treponema sp.]
MKNFIIKEIPGESYFSKPLYLDDHFLLAAPEMPFTEELRKTILNWEFKEVFSDGDPREEYYSEEVDASPDQGGADTLLNDNDQVKRAEVFYDSLYKHVEKLFTRMMSKNELNFNDVAGKVKEICDVIKEDRRFLLRVRKNTGPEQTYTITHAINTTIISIIIGGYLKLPNHRLIELGVAALLHEIGMLKLPPQIYLNNRPLTPQEKKAILTHPVLSFNMLKSFNFPLTVSLAALEHHERENGGGYPQKLMGDKISLYAKIIAVACSYEALTSSRPHKDAKDGYTGMIDLLKNVGKQYDDTIVRALVYSLSIYPIGLYVLLSNGKKGQVIDVNAENPRFPMVQIFGDLTPDGKNKILETSQEGVHIVRPLRREEIS